MLKPGRERALTRHQAKTKASHKTSSSDKPQAPEIAQVIVDTSSAVKRKYLKGQFLGKGGFAKCYELTDMDTKKVYAGKIVSKLNLMKSHQRDKMAMEIAIHKQLCHQNVVGFHGFFEDENFVYVILELCRKRSLMELHKRRHQLTEEEARYYLKQITEACCYLHDNDIIHRDLKLGNLFLNDDMEIKLGDFGLATKVETKGEKKKTLCGTPNYIAPEVLYKHGHSFEVDVWSLGCIMYTMLVGKPPFETKSLKETYERIKTNQYYLPSKVSRPAQSLIIKLLRPDPTTRPSMKEVLNDEFFRCGYLPIKLPVSCLAIAPRFPNRQEEQRRPLGEVTTTTNNVANVLAIIPEGKKPAANPVANISHAVHVKDGIPRDIPDEPENEKEPDDCCLGNLQTQLSKFLRASPELKDPMMMDEAEDPALTPMYWVSKWVDYSDKYGLGYQLNDGSVGVLFNDATRLLLNEDQETLQYIERNGTEHFHTVTSCTEALTKKMKLLEYFTSYMKEHLLKAGADVPKPKGMEMSRLPFLRTWIRTRSAIVLFLSCGILQINFFQDHTKIIVCPKMGAVTYIDENKQFRTFKLSSLEQYGCSKQLASRLRYARTMVSRLQEAHA